MLDVLDQDMFETTDYSAYYKASSIKRFINFTVDVITFYAFMLILGLLIGLIQVISGINLIGYMEEINPLVDRLISGLLLALYLAFLEYFFKGKTLGKVITKTRAVNEDGTLMNFRESFKRNLCRLIPFDALSFLFSSKGGWHDTVSYTMVVDLTNRSEEIKEQAPISDEQTIAEN